MPVQGTQFSPSAYMVNKAQDFFAVGQTDGKVKYTAKVVGRILPNAALAVASLVETVVLAILTAVTFLPSYISSRPYDACKAGTALAGRATKEALKGIVGSSTENSDTSKALTRKEKVMAFVNQAWTKVRGSAKNAYSSAATALRNNPGKVKIAAGVVGLVAAYFIGSKIAGLFRGEKSDTCPAPTDTCPAETLFATLPRSRMPTKVNPPVIQNVTISAAQNISSISRAWKGIKETVGPHAKISLNWLGTKLLWASKQI